jgi:hypothetical protein
MLIAARTWRACPEPPRRGVDGVALVEAGAAVITTIYFGALAGGPAHAMTLSLLTVIALGVLSCLAIPLLPSHAQPAGGPH